MDNEKQMKQMMVAAFKSGVKECICPECNGTGHVLYIENVENYGEVQYSRDCPKCSVNRRAEDITGIPPKYYDADLGKFDFQIYSRDMTKMQALCENFVEKFEEWDRYGKGLYLWSKTPGSGKTFLACCLARSLMLKYNQQMRFVTVIDYISLVSDSYKCEKGDKDPSEIYRNCKILVLDDIGAQMDKEWHRQEIFRLINTRMENGKITLYTSNVCPESLNVDERTKDRIIRTSVVLQLPEEGIRRKKAAMEQAAFLKKIMEPKENNQRNNSRDDDAKTDGDKSEK